MKICSNKTLPGEIRRRQFAGGKTVGYHTAVNGDRMVGPMVAGINGSDSVRAER